ncbi:CWC16 protein [Rhodocollybia butyracea]|uniref:CWC16 protein n=1 Tax=Rhodocollybia butyracea TaxID=206335 RepID=A0A9P5P8U9_9AGAR|nr:CWC16 protein [Rhodocollybia butyracea]
MQGFNKYYPPDYDGEKHGSLNSYRGKHALGDRARKIDQGILITRFELPFNIWCGTCNNHIGMGVRYNAEKKKIGNYYSTPIFSFRCKCHLCDGWFEVQTDPKNTRYVVTSGARQKDEDWDPEENGGFAVHDTDASATPNHQTKVQIPRLESLMDVSEHYNSDPYALSLKVRKHFREDKKIRKEKEKLDTEVKDRLADEDEDTIKDAKEQWRKGREEISLRENKRRKIIHTSVIPSVASSHRPSPRSTSKASSSPVDSLRARVLSNTARSRLSATTSMGICIQSNQCRQENR